MFLASAYPNSALSAGQLTLIALVMAGVLALWLGLVFLADRNTQRDIARRAGGHLAVMTQLDAAAQDEHSGAGPAEAGPSHSASHGAAA